MFNIHINRSSKSTIIFFLLICILFLLIFTKIVHAQTDEDEIIEPSNVLPIHDSVAENLISSKTDSLISSKINYPEHHIEIILFNNLNSTNKQSLSTFDSKNLNKNGTIDFQLKAVKPKFLLNVYDKLEKDPNYKVLFYSATQYSLLPSQRIKKFLINSKSKNNINNPALNLEDFIVVLVINKNKNMFNVMFDGVVNKVRLRKFYKLKPKEIYYVDHPMFGALITIVNL